LTGETSEFDFTTKERLAGRSPRIRFASVQDRAVGVHPPDHRLVHPLPIAPQFVGRGVELEALRIYWDTTQSGVVALIGLGGAGKTAIAARFLEELTEAGNPSRPLGLFVWSFYQEPDVGYFLEEAYRYFGGPDAHATPAKGAGLLHMLRDALSRNGRHLLVLDGLERVQRQENDDSGSFGHVEDPLLKGLLTRIAAGVGEAVVLVTSRFPLTDLVPFAKSGYRPLAIEGLDLAAAIALLRGHGVRGSDGDLAGLVDSYGAHALTLDHLGGLVGQFLEGDPKRAPEVPEFTSPKQDRQALRLARLFRTYEAHLPPTELDLLCRLCLLRRSVNVQQIVDLFLCHPPVRLGTLRELKNRIKLLQSLGDLDARLINEGLGGNFRGELAVSIQDAIAESGQQSQLAGPDSVFQERICQVVDAELLGRETKLEDDVEEVLRIYGTASLDFPTVERPLSWSDQDCLRKLIRRYNELRHHPLLPFQEPPTSLEVAFLIQGWIKTSKQSMADLTPADVVEAFRRVKQTVWKLAIKHAVLRQVRKLCDLHQKKWESSGVLSALDSGAMGKVLEALIARHLVLREADGSVSVHPAVRDYFGQLATASQRGFWHHLIGEHLIGLIQKPGVHRPADQAALDLVEEAIAHALEAGQTDKALHLYMHVLGGHRHLAWKLGEMARGLRIIRSFDPCPDRWALGWYLRALGELDEAYEQNNLAFFRADVRLLQGQLAEVEEEGEPTRTAIADFLMGRTTQLPAFPLGCAIPRPHLLLYLGQTSEAWLSGKQPEEVYELIGWADDRARCQLYRAEAASTMGDAAASRLALDQAARWVLHSGSVEHLCLYHLFRCRRRRRAGEDERAWLAMEEGLHIARQSGLGLYLVELLCERAELLLNRAAAAEAEGLAREALRFASMPRCQFVWGAAQAGHLLGRALIVQRRQEEARAVLEDVRSLRVQIGDFRREHTETLIRSLPV
jgi:hypothetical protein